jgi:glycosyltransferase 2 family protein
MKKITAVKIFLTVLIMAVLLFKVNIFEVVNILFSMDMRYLIGAFLLVPVTYLIRTFRWSMMLEFFEIFQNFFRSFKIILIGVFYGLITPGKIGELGRAYHMPEKKVLTLPTVFMEKLVDISTLIVLCFFTIIIWFPKDTTLLLLLSCSIIMLIFGVFFLTNEKFIFAILKFARIESSDCDQFSQNFRRLLCNYPLMGKSFLLSLLYYLISYFIGFFIILAGGFLTITVTTMPIIILLGNIPLTISGLGIRESIGSIAFVYLGDSAANGFVFAFLLFVITTVIPGIFGYFFAMREG